MSSSISQSNPVKSEVAVKQEQETPNLKGSGNPSGEDDGEHGILSDPEDYLEEDESLDMNLKNGDQKIWLVKLPKYLADAWNSEGMSGQRLGNVKIKNSNKKLQVKLQLNEEHKREGMPQLYDINMLNTQVKNSFVFNEENLKKFKQELTEVGDMPEQPELQAVDKKRAQFTKPYYRVQKNNAEQGKKFIPFVKTIPKKTALMGQVCHDCQIVPAKDDANYGRILSNRQSIQPAKARPKVTLLDEIPGVTQSNAGPSIRGNNTSLFLKTNPNRIKAEGRAIRMPKKDLLDLLFRLFEEYDYWSMKGLKERTRQPESYLKESLESIAILIKKGPYTSKYSLKPEYKRLRDAGGAVDLKVDENDEKEEDDVEMEDVI